MSWPIDETHEAAARSWVASANVPGCDFPIQNLPFGVFEAGGHGPRIGVAIGDSVFDPHAVAPELLDQLGPDLVGALRQQQLNQLMSIPRPQRTALRRRIFELL
ncbi:MAG: fumarylacetoacetase, partial [Acidobacteriia bacterium]|nr:fumarylacetoacetase [Terriglobia bacterium]